MALAPILLKPRLLTWEPPREDAPTRGEPLAARVESAALPHRLLLEELELLPSDVLEGSRALDGSRSKPGALRLVAGITAVHALLSQTAVSAGEALAWFLGSAATPAAGLSGIRWSATPDQRVVSLLPYVLDPFGLTTRRGVLSGRACRLERDSRKRIGTFYTPGDVARALVREVVTRETRLVLDPACGAGVFLRAAFTELCRELPPDLAISGLWGADIDSAAVDACALVLTHDWIARQPLLKDELPVHRFDCIRGQMVAGDALEMFGGFDQPCLFSEDPSGSPSLLPRVFDAVLVNPPFAAAGPRSPHVVRAYASLSASRVPSRVNMMWPFWELAARAVALDGRVGIVLPLSAAYLDGDVARATRAETLATGRWKVRFFDRTPDALFGDDVKQRVMLAVRLEGPGGTLRTSGLERWSADQRAAVLSNRAIAEVEVPTGSGILLKIGTTVERRAVDHLRSLGGNLGDSAAAKRLAAGSELSGDPAALAVAPTAYNWIGGYRDTVVAARARRHAAGKLPELTFSSDEVADAAYGILVSNVFLWWWRATGDLFHVPLACLVSAPFPVGECGGEQLRALAAAGRACWRAALSRPVSATNRGVETLAFRPAEGCPALASLDQAVADAFSLPAEFVRFVRDDAVRLRVAGRKP